MVSTDALGRGEFELGYWLSSEEHAPHDLVANAVAAEAVGFHTAMISDHFAPWVSRQGNSGFVWAILGGIASRTSEIRIGPGVAAAVHRMHPLVVAHAAATLETMMPGRFFLGLGTGERLNEAAMGERWPAPAERREILEEAIDIIRDLWVGNTVTRSGPHFTLERARLRTRPDVSPPIVVAAGGKRTAQLAGKHADGILGVANDPTIIDAFEAAGGSGKPRLAQVHICWANSVAEARETVLHWWPNGGIPSALNSELALSTQFEEVANALGPEAVLDGVALGPDPQVHAKAIARFVAAGFRTIFLHQIGPDQKGFFEFFRTELAPVYCRA